eukprot:jgi/Mesvir1/11085/Mv02459-RA.1
MADRDGSDGDQAEPMDTEGFSDGCDNAGGGREGREGVAAAHGTKVRPRNKGRGAGRSPGLAADDVEAGSSKKVRWGAAHPEQMTWQQRDQFAPRQPASRAYPGRVTWQQQQQFLAPQPVPYSMDAMHTPAGFVAGGVGGAGTITRRRQARGRPARGPSSGGGGGPPSSRDSEEYHWSSCCCGEPGKRPRRRLRAASWP